MKIDRKLAISLQIKRYALGPFLGMYRSLFRGQGVEYDEIRKYVPGDDPKALVWSKLAQTGEAYTKTFVEERDLTVIVALDISGSMFWARQEKSKLALEAASVLLFSAAVSRDRVGLALFSDTLHTFIPPDRGLTHAGRLVETLGKIVPGERKTSLKTSFQAIGARRGPKRAAIFIISDFMCVDEKWETQLEILSKKNDIIALNVQDTWENTPESLGWIYSSDAEKGGACLVNFDEEISGEWKRGIEEEKKRLKKVSLKHDIGCVAIDEGENPLTVLRAYFERQCHILKRR